jgi:YfiH family protein
MFRFSKKGSVEYLESIALDRWDFLTHAFCTRWSGVSEGHFASLNFSAREGDVSDNVRQNWEVMAEAFDLCVDQFFIVDQVHGDRILIADHMNIGRLGCQKHQVDAIVTDQTGLAVGIKTADCAPVFLVDRVKRIVGVVHAGWRGTALNISAKTVATFTETFSSRPADMVAVIGPAIGPCCYQVDEAVFQAVTGNENWEFAFIPCREKGKWMLDLPSANRGQLIQAGIRPENVFSADVCTSCRKDIFFSHRGEGGKTGRHVNFMMLKENNSA